MSHSFTTCVPPSFCRQLFNIPAVVRRITHNGYGPKLGFSKKLLTKILLTAIAISFNMNINRVQIRRKPFSVYRHLRKISKSDYLASS